MVQGIVVQEYRRCLGGMRIHRSVQSPKKLTTYLFHDRKHPGLIIIVAVRANTQVNLLGEWVDFVRSSELEDAEMVIKW